jgi:A/G-specific adenine glycosylase
MGPWGGEALGPGEHPSKPASVETQGDKGLYWKGDASFRGDSSGLPLGPILLVEAKMRPGDIPRFRDDLLGWFITHQRQLPWRQTRNPYHIWVSEVMLQQTQVKNVLSYYPRFLETFPDIQSLAAADLQEVLKAWEGMGYYGRARHLHTAARILARQTGGEIPAEYHRFRKLPGVGEYIGAAVQSLAFDNPYPVVDGNVKRVISRLFCIDSPMNLSVSVRSIRQRAAELFDHDRPGLFNQAVMELGATICRPRQPVCPDCPVSRFCEAYQTNRQNQIPPIIKSKPLPKHHIAVGIISKNKHLLITRRKSSGLLGGLWEFPGGKIKKGETAEEACVREMREEVNLSIEIIGFLTRIKHAYTHFKVVMDVFRCRYQSGEVVLRGPVDYRWITIDEIDMFPFPRANHKFIPLLRAGTGKDSEMLKASSLSSNDPQPGTDSHEY